MPNYDVMILNGIFSKSKLHAYHRGYKNGENSAMSNVFLHYMSERWPFWCSFILEFFSKTVYVNL